MSSSDPVLVISALIFGALTVLLSALRLWMEFYFKRWELRQRDRELNGEPPLKNQPNPDVVRSDKTGMKMVTVTPKTLIIKVWEQMTGAITIALIITIAVMSVAEALAN